MVFPTITAFYAALFGLVLFALSGWVIVGRGQYKVLLGDGGNESLIRRIRAHANFVEYVPLILILDGLLEISGASHLVLRVMLTALLIARVLHPFGMTAKENSMQQFALRGLPAVTTFVVLLMSAILLLIRVW